MNKDRRKAIDAVMADIEAAKALHDAAVEAFREFTEACDGLASQIEDLKDEEQEYYDTMPESFQSGDKGQAAEAAVSQMEEAMGLLQEYAGLELDSVDLDSAVSYLDEAKV